MLCFNPRDICILLWIVNVTASVTKRDRGQVRRIREYGRLQYRLLLNTRTFSQSEIQKRIISYNAESGELPLNDLSVVIRQRLAGKFLTAFLKRRPENSSDSDSSAPDLEARGSRD